ncbi:MAG: branched-chain amino acid aminotransferase, partial [Belnapia sp.]|nr:branched-chain amino acid aminotransferase [Belnapia sp.]
SEEMSVAARGTTIHLAIAAWEWGAYFGVEQRMTGVRHGMAKWKRPAPDTAPTASKAAGLYMIGTMSKHAAADEGYDDALMLDYKGDVAEATGANVFFNMGGELHTPTPVCFLDGITRRTVMGLARQQQIKVVERTIRPDELKDASEVFLVGTAAEVTPVREIAGLRFTPGELTRRLMTDYAALVRLSPEQVAKNGA